MKNNKNITHLNNYSINKTLDFIRQQKRERFIRVRTFIIAVAGVLFIGLASLPLIRNHQTIDEYNTVHAKTAQELKKLLEERKELEYQVSLLEDEEYIAKLARHELNVSKENEILINLPEKVETAVEEESSEEKEDQNTDEGQ